MTAYLGVDGGGTKTAFRLIDEHGATLATSTQPTSYYFGGGIGVLERVLRDGIADVTADAGIRTDDIAHTFFGVPGYGEASADVPRVQDIARRVLGHERYTCGNDMLGGWAGSLGGRDGINVIAGTGSMSYGERGGVGHRVGGWSEIFGDEGSGYWVGIRGLTLFSRMADGRSPRTQLYDAMRTRLGVTEDLDAIGTVMGEWGAQRTAIADLSKTVVDAAEAGDPAARAVLVGGADALVELVTAARTALEYAEDDEVVVSYSGGMFSAPLYRDLFVEALTRAGAYTVVAPRYSPDLGSALYAMRCAGVVVPDVLPAGTPQP
ncbi:N-acetylglucosamine kinase [Microbacterium aurum]